MAHIEGFRVKNFKTLKDIELGHLPGSSRDKKKALSPLTVVIGKNGVGKSSLFNAFGFLADCLEYGIEKACDNRGGYDRIISKDQTGPLEFEIYYREHQNTRPIIYELAIDLDKSRRPFVLKERLRQHKTGEGVGGLITFLKLEKGKGTVFSGKEGGMNENESSQASKNPTGGTEKESVNLSDMRRLGIATLGSLKEHPRIVKFTKFIKGWYLSYFTPDAARSLPLAGPQAQLNIHGDNLANVVQFMEREQPKLFQNILKNISTKIPGIKTIRTQQSPDGRLLLCFNDRGFKEPFFAQQMSDGTLKLFSYLLMLENPTPPPFICIEEPENGLYHKLSEILVREFRSHATGKKGGSQLFITTHQPYLVNALTPEEVWILEKQQDGFSTIERASDNELVKNMVEEGIPLGSLWYSDYLNDSEN